MRREDAEPIDCRTRVITPENIEFQYDLAGPFQRLPAFLFDWALRVAVFAIAWVSLGMLAWMFPISGALMMIILFLGFFVLSWLYGIVFETWFNGRTPGKMLFKLRVLSVDGRPINALQAATRNLLRLADMCLLLPLQVLSADAPMVYVIPTMLVGLIAMTLTPRMQRLGDLAAGTMVISEMAARAPRTTQPEDPRTYGLADLIPADFQADFRLARTIGEYMENRQRLSPARRNELCKHLAVPMLNQFGMMPDTSFDLLMCALYVRIFMSAEQREAGQARWRDAMHAGQVAARGSRPVNNPPPHPPSSARGG